MEKSLVVASAPGKVLVTGGYLLLEKPNAGLVLSTSARFFAITKPFHSRIEDASWAWSWIDVVIVSPQLSKEIVYKLSLRNFGLQNVSPSIKDSNIFVEKALELAIATANFICQDEQRENTFRKTLLKGLHITILGSNDFYSYRKHIESKGLPLANSTLISLPQFSPITFNSANDLATNIQVPEVAKTGLGSSAAMTSAVVASVLCYLGAVQLPRKNKLGDRERIEKELNIVHVVSQAAHSLAQGKIGSGFDVSAAVFGSQRYVRFSPQILSCIQNDSKYKSLSEVARSMLQEHWDTERREFALPPSLKLIIGEPGYGGSHTPSMVGAIQCWQKSFPQEARALWSELGHSNMEVETNLLVLKKIAKDYAHEYETVLQACEDFPAEQWRHFCQGEVHSQVVDALLAARQAFLKVRSLLRQLGEAAGVPVEPTPQTTLLDATMSTKGVLFAGVPGAGGYDAVFAITLSLSSRQYVEEMWTSQSVLSLCVFEDPAGVQLEDRDPREMSVTIQLETLTLQT